MQLLKAIAVVAVVFSAGCWVKAVTREDRAAVSEAISTREAGTITTDRELSMADQDQTVICEDSTGTGSHIPARNCRTTRQIEEEKENAQRLNTVRASQSRPEPK